LGEAETFIGCKEESLVAAVVEVGQNHWSAYRGSIVVRNDVRLVGSVGPIRDGVKAAVLEIPECRAMNAIRTRLGDSRDFAGLSVFGIVVDTVDAYLCDGFGRRKGIALDVVGGLVLRRDPIDRCF
jgi:hypothetical protein